MKKSRLMIIILIGSISLPLGSILTAEGSPFQVLSSIIKMELGDSTVEVVKKDQDVLAYVSKSGKKEPYTTIKEKMKEKGWVFQEEDHSSLLFEKDGEVFGTDVKEYMKGYVVWDAPKEGVRKMGRGLEMY